MQLNAEQFLRAYADVMNGQEVGPRGQLTREVCDYAIVLNMADSPLTSFKARNLNLKYAKQEFLWYLRADKFDRSIEKYATMWQKIRQPDGSYFSNYGQYIFPRQYQYVLECLTKDVNSRRASIVLLKPDHLFHDNKDVVCTYAINFRIRNGQLDMTVMMRSNDIIFGMTNDVFCFSMLYRMVLKALSKEISCAVGTYTHFVNSLHVYERHFPMIEQLVKDWMSGYEHIYVPWPTEYEANFKDTGPWLAWLNEDK
jgi:thymidylate synthase